MKRGGPNQHNTTQHNTWVSPPPFLWETKTTTTRVLAWHIHPQATPVAPLSQSFNLYHLFLNKKPVPLHPLSDLSFFFSPPPPMAFVPSFSSLSSPSSLDLTRPKNSIGGLRIGEIRQTGLGSLIFSNTLHKDSNLRVKATYRSPGQTQERDIEKMETSTQKENAFDEMKQRFLQFKKQKYLGDPERYENLANAQAPKFLVIACADSRVCPSTILGFQPGDAFIVRNVANLVPPVENGPSETKAALEFSVNTLKVPNILVVGHSCCGGIRALMGMEDNKVDSSSFIHSWVITGKNARLSTKLVASNLSFDQQCRHCEKESINRSLANLLGYPWIKEKVTEGSLLLHGGYYNFVDCTFEKWTLECNEDHPGKVGDGYSIKNREFWS